jgi:hypothetical protein
MFDRCLLAIRLIRDSPEGDVSSPATSSATRLGRLLMNHNWMTKPKPIPCGGHPAASTC